MLFQPPLPPKYNAMSEAELGKRLVILGHHYQQDEVIAFADFTGGS